MFGFRNTKNSCRWYCKHCQKVTKHTVPDPDSEWQTIGGKKVFRRFRQCQTCFNWLKTYEVKATTYEKLVAAQTECERLQGEVEGLKELIRQYLAGRDKLADAVGATAPVAAVPSEN